MGYPIEVRIASKNGWHTPAEARAYYGRYARDGFTWHWWGDGGAGSHDGTVKYILNKAINGAGSVNYVVSDSKITLLVDPRNVAWASQGGNPTTISVELQTYLGAEGYKKAGWLKYHLEKEIGVGNKDYPHKFWFSTQCPGTISIDRIYQEYLKWKGGAYDPKPAPPVKPPAQAELQWTRWKEGPITYVTKKNPTKLWNFNQTTWAGFGNGVNDYAPGTKITIVGEVINKTLNAKYLLTEYSFSKGITHGFNAADLDVYVPPRPVPEPPTPKPETPPPYAPEWEANLRDIDDTKYWVKSDCNLVDIKTGRPVATKNFKKDDEFIASALTKANGVEYRITQYSFEKKIYAGLPISQLTLTAPGVPDVKPIPEFANDSEKLNWIIKALKSILKLLGINI